jgi:hypothetical protein
VQQANVGIGSNDLFSIQFEDQSQDTVGGRMLGTEIDSVVSNFAAFILIPKTGVWDLIDLLSILLR